MRKSDLIDHHEPYKLIREARNGQFRVSARASCANRGCSTFMEISLGHPKTRHLVVEMFVRKGWKVKGTYKGMICPECQKSKQMKGNKMPKPKLVGPMVGLPTTKQIVLIGNAIDQVWDVSNHCYLDGYSDAKVAEQCDVMKASVVNIRTEAFGELRVAPEVKKLHDECEEISATVVKLQADVTNLRRKIAACMPD